MPYIIPVNRSVMTPKNLPIGLPGDLNFAITKLIDQYLQDDLNYSGINTVIGVLECAKLELYRRVAAPYEDKKCADNGDVYECLNDTEFDVRDIHDDI